MSNDKLESGIHLLRKLYDGLKQKTEQQFAYNSIVTDYKLDDHGNICGTVCCALGYAQELIPESGIYLALNTNPWFSEKIRLCHKQFGYELWRVFGVTNQEFQFMFFGAKFPYSHEQRLSTDTEDNYGYSLSANLQQVLNRIERVLKEYNA